MAVARLSTIDRATLGYVAAIVLVMLYIWRDGPGQYWPFLIAAYALLAACALLAPAARAAGPAGRILGEWYPLILLGAVYTSVGIFNLEEAHAYDPVIRALEEWLFGSHYAYRWMREYPSPWLSWALHVCYLSYYVTIFAVPLALWFSGRHTAARRALATVMVTFYVCYAVFILFPVTGPRYMFPLPDNAAATVAPAQLTQWILNHGDSWGAAFPSSHVAAYLVTGFMARRAWPRLGAVVLPFALGLVPAVVYIQSHYVVDSAAGVLLAGGVLRLRLAAIHSSLPDRHRSPHVAAPGGAGPRAPVGSSAHAA
jgi:hypothetical protein